MVHPRGSSAVLAPLECISTLLALLLLLVAHLEEHALGLWGFDERLFLLLELISLLQEDFEVQESDASRTAGCALIGGSGVIGRTPLHRGHGGLLLLTLEL